MPHRPTHTLLLSFHPEAMVLERARVMLLGLGELQILLQGGIHPMHLTVTPWGGSFKLPLQTPFYSMQFDGRKSDLVFSLIEGLILFYFPLPCF